MSTATYFSTFWIRYGRYGERLTLEQLRGAYFPDVTIKTMRNKMGDGLLPHRTGDAFDTAVTTVSPIRYFKR